MYGSTVTFYNSHFIFDLNLLKSTFSSYWKIISFVKSQESQLEMFKLKKNLDFIKRYISSKQWSTNKFSGEVLVHSTPLK